VFNTDIAEEEICGQLGGSVGFIVLGGMPAVIRMARALQDGRAA